MKSTNILLLKIIQKIYLKIVSPTIQLNSSREENAEKASSIIYKILSEESPCMIARFGSTELSALVNYLGVNSPRHSYIKYIQGKQPEWWWNKNIMNQMQQWSGFFPPTPENMQKFGDLMMKDIPMVDILGSWIDNERYFEKELTNAQLVHLRLLEPFWSKKPWTKALEGKKVLVVHPFAKTIISQYNNHRTQLFKNPDILPLFQLETIEAIQSLGGDNTQFKDWFEALEFMKKEIDSKDYDICLIGCGAYGFPLAAHIKRKGKKAIHMGGALQLLFGIKGKRWEDPNYGVKEWSIPYGSYTSLINEYWVRPENKTKPQNANQVEGGCYW